MDESWAMRVADLAVHVGMQLAALSMQANGG